MGFNLSKEANYPKYDEMLVNDSIIRKRIEGLHKNMAGGYSETVHGPLPELNLTESIPLPKESRHMPSIEPPTEYVSGVTESPKQYHKYDI